jgi:hypothetical protein
LYDDILLNGNGNYTLIQTVASTNDTKKTIALTTVNRKKSDVIDKGSHITVKTRVTYDEILNDKATLKRLETVVSDERETKRSKLNARVQQIGVMQKYDKNVHPDVIGDGILALGAAWEYTLELMREGYSSPTSGNSTSDEEADEKESQSADNGKANVDIDPEKVSVPKVRSEASEGKGTGCMAHLIVFDDYVQGTLFYNEKTKNFGIRMMDGALCAEFYYKSKDEALKALYVYKKYTKVRETGKL